VNYTELQTAIANQFARTDLPASQFITLAEEEMNRTLRVQGMEEMTSATPLNQTDNGLWYLTFPADMLQLKHIESNGVRLEFLSNNQMNTDAEGYYTIANELLLFANANEVDIYYFKKVPVLSDTNETNLFTEIGSDALFYLACDHAEVYMGQPGPSRGMATERMIEVVRMDDKGRHAGAPLVQRG